MTELEEKARALAPYLIALRDAIVSDTIRLLIEEFLDALDDIEGGLKNE